MKSLQKTILNSVFLILNCVCVASADDIPVTLSWDVEVTTARPYVADVMRGETVALAAQLRRLGKPVALPDSATATLYWQTNGMANAWWTAPATVSTSGVVSAVWTPGMDAGAPAYGFFIAAADGASVTYRAFGTLRMVHAPGANPNAELPPPPATIDFDKYTILNAPWVETDDFIAGTNALWAAFVALDFTETDPVALPKIDAHIGDKNNPHDVTPAQIGAATVDHGHSAISNGVTAVAAMDDGAHEIVPGDIVGEYFEIVWMSDNFADERRRVGDRFYLNADGSDYMINPGDSTETTGEAFFGAASPHYFFRDAAAGEYGPWWVFSHRPPTPVPDVLEFTSFDSQHDYGACTMRRGYVYALVTNKLAVADDVVPMTGTTTAKPIKGDVTVTTREGDSAGNNSGAVVAPRVMTQELWTNRGYYTGINLKSGIYVNEYPKITWDTTMGTYLWGLGDSNWDISYSLDYSARKLFTASRTEVMDWQTLKLSGLWTLNGADIATKNDIPPPVDTSDFATRGALADSATASTNYVDIVTAPLASEEWVEQTYYNMQTYSNMTDRAGLRLAFGERFRVYSTTTLGVTNSVSFSGSVMTVTFIADGFANSEAQLWSDALILIDKLRGRVTQYNADAVETRAIADGAVTRRLKLPDESGTFATREYIDLRVPTPPASGTYVLKSVNGAVQWVAE